MDGTDSPGQGQVFALIVGINNYVCNAEYPTLRGCVNDAEAFREFLQDPRDLRGLQVPPCNILLLTDEAATRARILSAFKSHLLENPAIPDKGSTLIFFFAGHGSRVKATDNLLPSDGMVETLCPRDENTLDHEGNYVHGIPDYVLAWLLRNLAEKKGNNITVILDSCHSGGLGREVGQTRAALMPSLPIPLSLDDYLWKGQDEVALSYRLWTQSAETHVLLAACREKESARETTFANNTVRGRFSESLIKELRRVQLENTTYAELLNCLPHWSGQNPHCGGANRDLLLFRKNYPPTGRRALSLTQHTKADPVNPESSQSFRVAIGSVEGVVPGTKFAVRVDEGTVLFALIAHSVDIHQTVLVTHDNQPVELPDGARATVEDWKNDAMVMPVFVAVGFAYADVLFPQTSAREQPMGRKFVQAPSADKADIVLRSEGDEVVIERCTSTVFEVDGGRQARFTLKGNTEHLPAVLDGIAHFNYFLERHHGSTPIEGVALRMHRLTGHFPAQKPDPAVGNMIVLDEAKFLSVQGATYGFTLCNDSNDDLFPYLFYFDPETYTIQAWYMPAGAAVQPPLRARGGELTVGMGGEGGFEFTLEDGQVSSSGFLKLFVSTDYINLGWIQQRTSPFDPSFEGTLRLKVGREPFVRVPKWDALRVVLTMAGATPPSPLPQRASDLGVV